MELKDLSSNWKKLQCTLQSTQASRSKKRKAEELFAASNHGVLKRRKQLSASQKQLPSVAERQQQRRQMERESEALRPIPRPLKPDVLNEGLSPT